VSGHLHLAPGAELRRLTARRLRLVHEHGAQVCKVDAETWQAHIRQGAREYTINGEDLEAVLGMAEILTESEPPGG
jgi:hypothetical protein